MRLRRVPAVYWIISIGLAACTSVTVFRLAAAADARARYWGTLASVPVVTTPIAAGATIESTDFEMRDVPESLLPQSSVVLEPTGLTAVLPIWPGEVLVEAKLAPAGLEGPAAMLEPGERAVAVPRIETTPPLGVGNRVDVILNLDAATTGGPPAIPIARAARVLHVSEAAVTLAVPAEQVAKVAFGAAQGALSLTITSPADWGSGAGGSYGDDDSAGQDAIDDERSEAPVADEAQQPPHGAEPGDGRGADADAEGSAEAGGDPAGAN